MRHQTTDSLFNSLISFQEMYLRLVVKRGLKAESKTSLQILNQVRFVCMRLYEDFTEIKQKFLNNTVSAKSYEIMLDHFSKVIKACEFIDHKRLHTDEILDEIKSIQNQAA